MRLQLASLLTSTREHTVLLRCPRRDIVHESRRQAVIRFEAQVLQFGTAFAHLIGTKATLDNRRYECSETRLCPASFLEPLRLYEGKSLERMLSLDRPMPARKECLNPRK